MNRVRALLMATLEGSLLLASRKRRRSPAVAVRDVTDRDDGGARRVRSRLRRRR
ncbi:MAG: hypothetical protein ACREQ5_21010 [Candidatus Dormibacteria bacterium]